jgi:hypothetical protein
MQQPDLSLTQVILLDRIQKGLPISRDEHQQLKKQRLVEGRFPNLIVSASVAKATGDTARHIRERGFEKKYYLDLILQLVDEHGPVARKEVDALLLPKLPERLSEEQKREKVHNLLQVSGDSENWSGGDTKTGPPRGARQHTHDKAGIDAISGADGSGDGGADPSGRGGDAAAGGSGMGPAADRTGAGLLA